MVWCWVYIDLKESLLGYFCDIQIDLYMEIRKPAADLLSLFCEIYHENIPKSISILNISSKELLYYFMYQNVGMYSVFLGYLHPFFSFIFLY